MNERLKELKEKYLQGTTTLEEEKELLSLVKESSSSDDSSLLEELSYYDELKAATVSSEFESVLEGKVNSGNRMMVQTYITRIAASILLIAVGFALGVFLVKPSEPEMASEITSLQDDIRQLQQISTEVLLRQESAHDRLKALIIANTIALEPDSAVIELIFRAYSEDDNLSIRISALELLIDHTADLELREKLFQSIEMENSEIILYKLVEMSRGLKDEKAIPVLEGKKGNEDLSPELRNEIEEAIKEIKS